MNSSLGVRLLQIGADQAAGQPPEFLRLIQLRAGIRFPANANAGLAYAGRDGVTTSSRLGFCWQLAPVSA